MKLVKASSMHSSRTQQSKWSLCLGVSFCALILTCWPDGFALFRYDRAAILSGQAWRLVSAHFAHLNATHLFLNVAGLFLLAELIWADLPVSHGLGLIGTTSIGISLLLWWRHPELQWYAGLSGMLHGLWAGCALAGLLPMLTQRVSQAILQPVALTRTAMLRNRYACLIGMLLLITKLVIEWRHGASASTEKIIGAPVVTAAHLYGALVGGAYVLIWQFVKMLRLKNYS